MKEFQHNFFDDKKNITKDISNISINRLPVILLLDGIKDIGNTGMIFRIADALRIKKIYIYNFKKKFNEKILLKKSRATNKYVDFEYLTDISQVKRLKNNYEIVIVDKTNKSIPYSEFEVLKPICLVVGAEITGVSPELINISDKSIHLPMNGINTSINVATATSVVLYEIYNKIKKH